MKAFLSVLTIVFAQSFAFAAEGEIYNGRQMAPEELAPGSTIRFESGVAEEVAIKNIHQAIQLDFINVNGVMLVLNVESPKVKYVGIAFRNHWFSKKKNQADALAFIDQLKVHAHHVVLSGKPYHIVNEENGQQSLYFMGSDVQPMMGQFGALSTGLPLLM